MSSHPEYPKRLPGHFAALQVVPQCPQDCLRTSTWGLGSEIFRVRGFVHGLLGGFASGNARMRDLGFRHSHGVERRLTMRTPTAPR